MSSPADVTLPPPSRPVRKDEIELQDRGLYIESWLPERRSRRRPLLFVHGELGGSWAWERFLGYFAGRGWDGRAGCDTPTSCTRRRSRYRRSPTRRSS